MSAHDPDWQDACGCVDLGEHHMKLLPKLFERGGVDKVAHTVSVAVIEELRSALRWCARECCPLHGDCDEVIDALQVVVNEADRCDELAEEARTHRAGLRLIRGGL